MYFCCCMLAVVCNGQVQCRYGANALDMFCKQNLIFITATDIFCGGIYFDIVEIFAIEM